MKFRMRVISAGLVSVLATSSAGVSADWVGDFYSAAGAGVNVTSPQAVASQSVVGYTGGGLTWRVPNKNLQPFSISPPSLKMGCNGIDAFLGAYSFVNMDAFVNALRNMGQAAVGYFFQLALRSMAPEIAVTLDVINDLANRANQFGANSCAMAKFAVDKIAGPMFDGMKDEAANRARAFGEQVDNFVSNEYFKTNYGATAAAKYAQNFGKSESSLTKEDVAKFEPVKVNVLWWAINHSDAANQLSDDEKELLMSLVGPTLILGDRVTLDDASEKNLVIEGKIASMNFEQLVGQHPFMSSVPESTARVLTCADVQCLSVVEKTETFKPFTERISEAVNRIREKIVSREKLVLDAEHETVIRLASVPLYRAAAMAESTGVAGGIASTMLIDLVDYAAIDAAMRMSTYYLSTVHKALSGIEAKIPTPFKANLQMMYSRIAMLQDTMRHKAQQYYTEKGSPLVKIDHLDKVERMMYSNLNSTLAANARFGKR